MYEIDAMPIIGVTGAMAFFVGLIVELTKELPGIKRLPTKLYAAAVSVAVCQMALWIYSLFAGLKVIWFSALLAFFASFVVCAVAVFGRDMLGEIINSFRLRDFYSRYKR